jgi:hypothetical protein
MAVGSNLREWDGGLSNIPRGGGGGQKLRGAGSGDGGGEEEIHTPT